MSPPDFWSHVVLEGDVTLTPVATSADDPAVDELAGLYRSSTGRWPGEHPDRAEYRAAVVDDQRRVACRFPYR